MASTTKADQTARQLAIKVLGEDTVCDMDRGLGIPIPSKLSSEVRYYLNHAGVSAYSVRRQGPGYYLCVIPRTGTREAPFPWWDVLLARYFLLRNDELRFLSIAKLPSMPTLFLSWVVELYGWRVAWDLVLLPYRDRLHSIHKLWRRIRGRV